MTLKCASGQWSVRCPLPFSGRGVRRLGVFLGAGVAALCGCSGPASAQLIQLYRANLHAHTAFSDGAAGGVDAAKGPRNAVDAARLTGGLSVIAITDHGEFLDPDEWAATKAQTTDATRPGSPTTPGTMVALWGFEWTKADPFSQPGSRKVGLGHLNVFGSRNRTGAGFGYGGVTEDEVTAAVLWHHYNGVPSTSKSIGQFMLDDRISPLGGTVVAQINHPALYPGVSLMSPNQEWADEWWRKLEWSPVLDPYIALIELGGRKLPDSSLNLDYLNGAVNEPYYQLALDNGWHVAPTNNEDNHGDHYGASRTSENILTHTGVWAMTTQNFPKATAQSILLAALRSRRVFSVEDKVADANGVPQHNRALSLKFTAQSPRRGLLWMGTRDLEPQDVTGNRVRLEMSRPAGLLLGAGASVDVITNRGVVARTLPTSGSGVLISGTTALWNFSLPGDAPAAQLRATGLRLPSSVYTRFTMRPLPDPQGNAPLDVELDGSATDRIERYFYIRVKQSDGTLSYTAPFWMRRDVPLAGGDDGIHRPRSGRIVKYEWNFGDGTPGAVDTVSDAASTDKLFDGATRHTYQNSGVYYPRMKVTYANGSTESVVSRVVVGSTTAVFKGDVNADNQVNRDDVLLVNRAVAGIGALNADQLTRADVSGNGRLDIADTLRIVRFMQGVTAAP